MGFYALLEVQGQLRTKVWGCSCHESEAPVQSRGCRPYRQVDICRPPPWRARKEDSMRPFLVQFPWKCRHMQVLPEEKETAHSWTRCTTTQEVRDLFRFRGVFTLSRPDVEPVELGEDIILDMDDLRDARLTLDITLPVDGVPRPRAARMLLRGCERMLLGS